MKLTRENPDLVECQMNEIIPRLYLSGDMMARNRELLRQKNITHILNLTTTIPNKFEPELKYLKITIFDFESQNISQFFNETFEFIDNALLDQANAVLVHCNAGISRSASFVIAYLLQKGKYKSYKSALNHVRKCRPIVCPNKGFEKQLLALETKIEKRSKCFIM